MKRRIVIGLSIFSAIFFLGGIYIITAVERGTSTLDNLIRLHQIEILREQLLLEIKKVQTDLSLKDTHYARGVDTVVANVLQMSRAAERCLSCHHPPEILARIVHLTDQIGRYKESLSRVLTIRANALRVRGEEDAALRLGEDLIGNFDQMVTLTKAKLDQKTRASRREISDTKIILYVLVALGPVLAIGLAVTFIQGFTKPLHALLGATRGIKGGDLGFRITPLKDEFGEVAASFNEMAQSLSEQMHKMQRAEQMTVVGQMAAGLVHEIKNPLAGIKASMQVLSEEGAIPEEDRAVLLKVIEEVRRIEMLMKSLLHFAKPPKPQPMAVDLNQILEGTLPFAKYPSTAGPGEGVRIVRNFDPYLPLTMADPVQLQQVFLNLFLNAAEAMPEGGTLTMSTSYRKFADQLTVEISDTGKGIEGGVKEKIFQPFFTTKHKGTGLGLAITKQCIEQHGGTIFAEDNHSGSGATFRITLPRIPAEEVQKS
ncbi:MAG: HAMP domain-containing protein [Deltaproteobacteria bacterium]|nr:HAMP domain-containing protein [Deltaproteobacteria bacterium]